MTGRLLRGLPSILAALAGTLMITSEWIAIGTGTGSLAADYRIWGIAVVFGVTGWVVASRHRRNPIGWLLLAASVSAGLSGMAGAWAQYYQDTGHGPDLLGGAAATYGDVSWIPFILLPATFLLALFPDGHLLSPRWRWVAWCAGVGMAGGFFAGALFAGPTEDYPGIDNPFGVDSPLIDPLNGVSLLLVAVGIVGSAASLVVRFRRSYGAERQQLKWLALAGVISGATIIICIPLYDVLPDHVADSLIMFSVMGLPGAAGIAILRYRLYDIDLVINRALVYGALTALLAATYLISVLLLQATLEPITQGSGLAVAASTLAAAALVRPARARIQAIVDRRFFRRKYDAAQTLAGFGARLRDEVDLDAVRRDLRAVVAETMQPSHISLWTPAGTRGDR
jgi:hypothetical protein